MTWIRTISPREADPELQAAYEDSHAGYPPEYQIRVPALADVEEEGGAAGIVASHSLIPDALRHAFSTFAALMAPDLPLTRRQQEMITTTVSALNHCYY
jgi:alkylhydroperoxidase family enzyme